MSEPIIKYKTGGWNKPIERVECTRETSASVWYMVAPVFGPSIPVEQKSLKNSAMGIYHDTWELARTHLVATREYEITKSQARIKYESEKIEKARKEIEVIKAWQIAESA